jgi:hypothetical protein
VLPTSDIVRATHVHCAPCVDYHWNLPNADQRRLRLPSYTPSSPLLFRRISLLPLQCPLLISIQRRPPRIQSRGGVGYLCEQLTLLPQPRGIRASCGRHSEIDHRNANVRERGKRWDNMRRGRPRKVEKTHGRRRTASWDLFGNKQKETKSLKVPRDSGRHTRENIIQWD